MEKSTYQQFRRKSNSILTSFILFKSFLKRILLLFKIDEIDFVFVHREIFPIGPPIFEWFIAKVIGKKIIYDFDDAIWLTDNEDESFFASLIRCRWKVRLICKWSHRVSCGNKFLADYARKFNTQVTLNPTTIDTDNTHNPALYPEAKNNDVVIGWTGSHSTLKYLEEYENILRQIESKHPNVQFVVIADRRPSLKLKNVAFKIWSQQREIEDLMSVDIGIMPLPDNEWTRGKCGFKALQYLALGKPAVVSPVAVNKEIISHGTEGYLATTEDQWLAALDGLIVNSKLRQGMGIKGRQKVIEHYSVSSNAETFLSLFQ